ncbi:MAG: Ig-like domain-containing protein [Phreatobacter sp.]|uniref:Ig-like domain-containing protein n=1 Tax=Phreatobacter sp. TaxID=1966341 RepID=UPI0040371198
MQSEIADLILGGALTRQTAVDTLQAMLPGAGQALSDAVNEQLTILLTDPQTLAQTAGLGTAAQVQAAANAIALLLISDPTGAQHVLDELAPRIGAGDLTGGQAADLLTRLYALGGGAETAALATIAALKDGQTGPAITPGTFIVPVQVQVEADMLSPAGALVLLGIDAPGAVTPVATSVAFLVANGHMTIADVQAAVTAGDFPAGTAIAAYGRIAAGGDPAAGAAAVAAIAALSTGGPALASAALDALLTLTSDASAAIRALGYAGLDDLAAAVPGMGAEAFGRLFINVIAVDGGIRGDAYAGLVSLLSAGRLTATDARLLVAAEIAASNPSPTLSPAQALAVLVALTEVESARAEIYGYIFQATHGAGAFDPALAVTAIANGVTDADGHLRAAAEAIAQFGPTLGHQTLITQINAAGNLSAADRAILTAAVGLTLTDPLAPRDFGAAAAAQMTGLGAQDKAAVLAAIGDLAVPDPNGILVPKVIKIMVAVFGAGQTEAALAGLAALVPDVAVAPASVTSQILQTVAAGEATAALGVDILIGLAAHGATGFPSAAAVTLKNGLAAGTIAVATLTSGVDAALAAGAATPAAILDLLEAIVLARFVDVATQGLTAPGEIALTQSLVSAANAKFAGMVAAGQLTAAEVVGVIVQGAAALVPAARLAAAEQIASLATTLSMGDAHLVETVLADVGQGLTVLVAAELLVGIAGAGDGDLRKSVGHALADLVADGTLAAGEARQVIYAPLLAGTLAADEAVDLLIGFVAGGGATASGPLLHAIASNNLIALATLAERFAAAADAGAVTALQVVTAAVETARFSGNMGQLATFLSALVDEGVVTSGGAIALLAGFIGPTGLTASSVMAVVAAMAQQLPGSGEISLGSGLADIIAGGAMTLADATGSLDLAVDGDTQFGIPPSLSVGEAVSILVGMTLNHSPASVAAGIPGGAQAHIVALIGSDGPRIDAAMDAIADFLAAGDISASQTLQLFLGLIATGSPQVGTAARATIADLVSQGFVSEQDLVPAVLAAAVSTAIPGATAVAMLVEFTGGDIEPAAFANHLSYLIRQGAVTAGDAVQSFLAAAAGVPSLTDAIITETLFALAMNGAAFNAGNPHGPATVAAAGFALAEMLSDGSLAEADFFGLFQGVPGSGGVPVMAAVLAHGVGSQSLADAIRAAMLDYTTWSLSPVQFAQILGTMISPEAIAPSVGLPLLTSFLTEGVAMQVGIGAALGAMLAAGATTRSAIGDALTATGIVKARAIVAAAAMIDPASPQHPADALAIAERILLSYPVQNDWLEAAGLVRALGDAIRVGYAGGGLRPELGVQALSVFSHVGNNALQAAAATEIVALVTSFALTSAAMFGVLVETAAEAGSYRNLEARQIGHVGAALGLTADELVASIIASRSQGPTIEQAVAVLAGLTSLNPATPGGLSDSNLYPRIGIAVGEGLLDLARQQQATIAHLLGLIEANASVSPDNKALIALGMAANGTVQERLDVGAALAGWPSFDILSLALDPPIPVSAFAMVLMGMAAGSGGNSVPAVVAIGFLMQAGRISAADLTSDIAGSVATGAMAPDEGVTALVRLLGVNSAFAGDPATFLRTSVADTLVAIVQDGHISAADAVTAAIEAAHGRGATVTAEAGWLIGAVVLQGLLAGETGLVLLQDAVAGGTVTAIEAARIMAGLAVFRDQRIPTPPSLDLPRLAGHALGALVEAGAITAADAVDAVHASATQTFSFPHVPGEVALLTALAAYGVPGLQQEVGHALGQLMGGTLSAADVLAIVRQVAAIAGGPTAAEILDVLVAAAEVAPMGAATPIAGALLAMVGDGLATLGTALADIRAAVDAGTLTAERAVWLHAGFAKLDAGLRGAMVAEIEAMIGGGALTGEAALKALFRFATGFSPTLDDADQTVAALVAGLVRDGFATGGEALQWLMQAAVDPLATLSQAALMARDGLVSAADAGSAISTLFVGGLSPEQLRHLFQVVGGEGVPVQIALAMAIHATGAVPGGVLATAMGNALGGLVASFVSSGATSLATAVATLHGLHEDGDIAATRVVQAIIAAERLLYGDFLDGSGSDEIRTLLLSGDLTYQALDALVRADIADNGVTPRLGHLLSRAGLDDDAAHQTAMGRLLGGWYANQGLDISAAFDNHPVLELAAASTGGVAVQAQAGLAAGRRLSAFTADAPGLAAAAVEIARLQQAVADGLIDHAAMVVILTAMGSLAGGGPVPLTASRDAFVQIIAEGDLTVAAAFDAVDATTQHVAIVRVVQWLAHVAADTESLSDTVAARLYAFATQGRLSEAQLLGAIGDVAGTAPAITVVDATALIVDLAGLGGTAMQQEAGTQIATLLPRDRAGVLDTITAAVNEGSLSGVGATRVLASAFDALATDPGQTTALAIGEALKALAAGGHLDLAAALPILIDEATGSTGARPTGFGVLLQAAGIGPQAAAAVTAAVDAGTLAPVKALDILLGLSFGDGFTGADFAAARQAIVGLIQAGTDPAEVFGRALAAGTLDAEQIDRLAMDIGLVGTEAAAAVAGAYFAAKAERFGPADDPFFAEALPRAAVDFVKVLAGQMTLAQAIADIDQYTDDNGGSAHAALIALKSLLTQYNQPGLAGQLNAILIDRIVLGDLSAELAGRVAEGLTDGRVNGVFDARDPDAITFAEARDLLAWESTRALLPEQTNFTFYQFANDVLVNYDVRRSAIEPVNIQETLNTLLLGDNYSPSFPGVGRISYAYDQSLAVLVELLAERQGGFTSDYNDALAVLSRRLVHGSAEDLLIREYAAGNLSLDQVFGALDRLVTASSIGSAGADPEIMHDIALSWLHLRAKLYLKANPSDPGLVRDLLFQLSDVDYQDDLLAGYGVLMHLTSGAGAITELEKVEVYDAVRGIIRSTVSPTMTMSEADQKFFAAVEKVAVGLEAMFNLTPLGAAYLHVGTNPTDFDAYARFGGQIAAQAGTSAIINAAFAGTPVGLMLTGTQMGAKIGLYFLAMGAVQDALGEGPTLYLRGQLTMASATASLLGNTMSKLGSLAAETVIESTVHFVAFGEAVRSGDPEAIASATLDIAMDYYKLQTGVDLRLYGVVGERFADFMVHLFTGDTGKLGDDVRALGSAFLDTIIKNVYLAAIGEKIFEYAQTINGALSDINDSYRILGYRIADGALLVGTGLDQFGNVLRDMAHKVGDWVTDIGDDILSGLGLDGYIAGATVFSDANFNGQLDPGETSTTTDARGVYTIAAGAAPLVLVGGTDISTNLPFVGKLTAPAGSTVITPLTTLVQKVASTGSGDPAEAQQKLTFALGLSPDLDINDLDTIAATKAGTAGAAEAFAIAAGILNTVAMIEAASGATDAFAAIAARVAAAGSGQVIDLADPATVAAIVSAAGLTGQVAASVSAMVVASNALLDQIMSAAATPDELLSAVTAASIVAQKTAADAIEAAGTDPLALDAAAAAFTGAALLNQAVAARSQVGSFDGGFLPSNVAPIAGDDTVSADLHGTVRLNVLANDSDADAGDVLTVVTIQLTGGQSIAVPTSGTAVVETAHGRLLIAADGSLTFEATRAGNLTPGQSTVDSITYTVADKAGATDTASVAIDITWRDPSVSDTFDFAFTAAQVEFRGNMALLTAPDGTVHDVSGLGRLTFSDGAIVRDDGSPLVDDLFYYARNPDVWAAKIDPEAHYGSVGWREGRDPNAFFSTASYPLIDPSGSWGKINPLIHYELYGWRDGRDPGPNFDTSAYLAAHPELAAAGINPLAHYLTSAGQIA